MHTCIGIFILLYYNLMQQCIGIFILLYYNNDNATMTHA